MWGASCSCHVSMELAALQVLLETIAGSILEHLEALVSQGTFQPVSLNCRARKEPRSWFWLFLLTWGEEARSIPSHPSEINPATTSHVLHCSHTTEPAQAWDVPMSSAPCGCDLFLKKGEGASVGAGSRSPAAGVGLCDPGGDHAWTSGWWLHGALVLPLLQGQGACLGFNFKSHPYIYIYIYNTHIYIYNYFLCVYIFISENAF